METASSIVHDYWTNAPITNILYKEIILFYWNNINGKKEGELNPLTVQQLWNIVCSSKSGSVAQYIQEQIVFTVAAIPRNENLRKSNVYRVVKDLEAFGVVEQTPYKAQNPDPSYTGPKARFWKLTGFDLSDGWANPLLKRAQAAYAASFGVSPEFELEQSKQAELLDISPQVMDYYKSRQLYGTFAPKPVAISAYIAEVYPELEPEYRGQLVQQVHNNLCNTKEVS